MLSGFSLQWPNAKAPYLIDPSGQRIDLFVDNYVPYISNAQLGTAADGGTVSTSSLPVPVPVSAGGAPEPDTAEDQAKGTAVSPSNSGATGSSEDPPNGPAPLPPPPEPWGLWPRGVRLRFGR